MFSLHRCFTIYLISSELTIPIAISEVIFIHSSNINFKRKCRFRSDMFTNELHLSNNQRYISNILQDLAKSNRIAGIASQNRHETIYLCIAFLWGVP